MVRPWHLQTRLDAERELIKRTCQFSQAYYHLFSWTCYNWLFFLKAADVELTLATFFTDRYIINAIAFSTRKVLTAGKTVMKKGCFSY